RLWGPGVRASPFPEQVVHDLLVVAGQQTDDVVSDLFGGVPLGAGVAGTRALARLDRTQDELVDADARGLQLLGQGQDHRFLGRSRHGDRARLGAGLLRAEAVDVDVASR